MLLNGGFSPDYLISLVYSIPAILIALCFHEFAHALVAYKLGDQTAKLKGRLTIDPSKHLDVFGTIAIILCGFGWAKPVPINPKNFKHPKRDEILVSIAGVCMNLIIAFIACLIFLLGVRAGANDIFINIVSPIIMINLYIAVFNVIPIPPLDGFHIISVLFIKKANAAVYALYRYGFIILLVLVFTGAVSFLLSNASQAILTGYLNFFSLFGL